MWPLCWCRKCFVCFVLFYDEVGLVFPLWERSSDVRWHQLKLRPLCQLIRFIVITFVLPLPVKQVQVKGFYIFFLFHFFNIVSVLRVIKAHSLIHSDWLPAYLHTFLPFALSSFVRHCDITSNGVKRDIFYVTTWVDISFFEGFLILLLPKDASHLVKDTLYAFDYFYGCHCVVGHIATEQAVSFRKLCQCSTAILHFKMIHEWVSRLEPRKP